MVSLVFGLGYLGAALAADLLERGGAVVGIDNGFATDWPALERLARSSEGRLRLRHGDVRDAAAVQDAFAAAGRVETVYLLAAQASAHPDAAPPEYTEETNLRGPRLVFDAALRHGAPPVVYGSSFHVYGAGLAGTVDERRPYGAVRDLSHLSKIYVEKLAEMYAAAHDLAVSPLRLGVVYGLAPVVKRDLRFVTVPHAFCLRALARQPLQVHASGLSPIAFVHVDDAVAALRMAGERTGFNRADAAATVTSEPLPGRSSRAPAGERYAPANVAVEVMSALDVARLVQQAAAQVGREVNVRAPAQAVAGPAAPSFAVVSRLSALGWRPTRRLAEALPEILAYYAASPGRGGSPA